MTWITVLLALVGLLALWAKLSADAYALDTGVDETHYISTRDGWRLALHRIRPAADAPKRNLPILMLHGLGANHRGFCIGPEGPGLANHLAAQGWDVWILDPRGAGLSERPRLIGGKWYGWTYDDLVERDAMAAIAYLQQATGSHEYLWYGHSLGGLVLYSLLARGLAQGMRAGALTGASLDYSQSASDFHFYLNFEWLGRMLPMIPAGFLGRLVAPFSGRWHTSIENFHWYADNMAPQTCRRLSAWAMDGISSAQLLQLASAIRPGGLSTVDGTKRDLDGLPAATTPVLAFCGDEDRQCPPDAARVPFAALGTPEPNKQLVELGLATGYSTHYGHIDMISGLAAPVEVWPQIVAWFERWDNAQPSQSAPTQRSSKAPTPARSKRRADPGGNQSS